MILPYPFYFARRLLVRCYIAHFNPKWFDKCVTQLFDKAKVTKTKNNNDGKKVMQAWR